jgi:hypothetical protein
MRYPLRDFDPRFFAGVFFMGRISEPKMVCTKCGMIGADVRPNCTERPERESLAGNQWRD